MDMGVVVIKATEVDVVVGGGVAVMDHMVAEQVVQDMEQC
jgi:hypothetical protein